MQVQLIILNTITSTRGLELPSTWWAFASAGIYTGQKSHRLDSPKYKAPICDYPHKKRNRIKLWNSLLFLLKPLVALAWTLSTAAGLAIVYGMTPYVDESKVPEISSAVSMTYGTLHRTAWAFVIEWIIFACSRGYGGKSTENHFLIKYLPLCTHLWRNRFSESVSVVEGILTARPVDLLRLPHPLRLPDGLQFRHKEAVLLHHVRNGHHLFRRPGLLLRTSFCGGRHDRSIFLEFGEVDILFIVETQKY